MRVSLPAVVLGLACLSWRGDAVAQPGKQPEIVSRIGALPYRDGAGELAADSEKDHVRGTRCKIYTVPLKGCRTYTVEMIALSDGFDPYLRLEDSAGRQLASDDDGGGGLNARIGFACSKDGTYRIIASTYAGTTGKFMLLVREHTPPGMTRIAEHKDRLQPDLPEKTYALPFEAGTVYQLDLHSQGFDGTLRVLDANRQQVACNTGGATGGPPSCVSLRFRCEKTETYHILVSYWGERTGSYRLSIAALRRQP